MLDFGETQETAYVLADRERVTETVAPWPKSTLGKHADLLTGYAFESESYSSKPDAIRLLRGDNVMPQQIRWDNAKKWDEAAGPSLSRYALRAGDTVVAMDRTWISAGAKVAQVKAKDLPSLLVQRVARLRARETLDQNYMYQLLSGHGFEHYVRSAKTETAVPHISPHQVRAFPILLPPLEEQRRIAEIFRAWDEAIELTEEHIYGLQTRRNWLRLEVLTGRVRMGNHAEPWSRTRLGGVLREHKKRSSGSEEVFSVSVHKGLVNQEEHLGRSFAAANTDRYNLVHTGDIVYTKSPTGNFPLGIIKRSSAPSTVIVSPLYGVFTPQNPDVGVILDAYFESPLTVQNYLRPLVQKGAKNTIAITNQAFLSGHLDLPSSPAEQRDLAGLLTRSREEIAAVERKAELLRIQKRGLMQKLLTGQIRVDIAAETRMRGHEHD
ncbi:restriction endonuclease subunit S [Pseudarthrobacter oxydans]|uniref:restriction endonuclease subunit S n=1 Tax=Pseudarthrobacter oxydans TaxID=1671 RepID=UPI0035E824A5|nr:hypothetical protein GCM10017547_19880 [Pseudarthrobacter oxydans]